MLSLSSEAPDFALEGVAGGEARTWRLSELKGWVVLFFYPADFTFVCPTEVVGFERRLDEFARIGASLLAVGVDDLESHREWATELGGIRYPLLSDPEHSVVRAYGVLNEEDGRPFRATFVINPERRIAYDRGEPGERRPQRGRDAAGTERAPDRPALPR